MHLNCSGKDAPTTLSPREELHCFQALFFFLREPDPPVAISCDHLKKKHKQKKSIVLQITKQTCSKA